MDANLHQDLATGNAVTAVLHFLNQTPIDAYTKRQSTVETATYGSEFVTASTAVDQIIDIRTTLRYIGVPIRDKSYMFGYNRSVDTSSTIPNSTISKRHHLASYHRVREAIAAKYISFHWKDGKSNPADILSKHWEFATVWPMLKSILFFTEVWILQGICPLKDEWVFGCSLKTRLADQTKTQHLKWL